MYQEVLGEAAILIPEGEPSQEEILAQIQRDNRERQRL
jgi:hypothetical protein